MIAWTITQPDYALIQANPNMTSNSQDGYITSASSTHDGAPWTAFNYSSYSNSSKWQTNSYGNCWLMIELPEAKCISQIEFANPADNVYSQNSSFKFEGSYNRTDWIQLASFSGLGAGKIHTLKIKNLFKYKFYRIHATTYNNTYSNKSFRVSWLKLKEKDVTSTPGLNPDIFTCVLEKCYYGLNQVPKIIIGDKKIVYQYNPYPIEYHNSKHTYSNQHYSCSIAWPTAELQNMVVKKFSTWSTTRRMSGDSYVNFSCTSATSNESFSKNKMIYGGTTTAEGTLDGIHYKITANSADNYGRYDVEFDKPIKLSAITGGCGSGVGQYRDQDHMYMEIWGFKKK